MTRKCPPTTEKRISLPISSVVAGLALCLLVGCGGGGGGGTTSSGTPGPDVVCRPGSGQECQSVDLPNRPDTPDTPDNFDDLLEDPVDPEDPGSMPNTPGPQPTSWPTGLLNQDKHLLVNAGQAWFSGEQRNVYIGKDVVVGIMEEVNPFHFLFDPTRHPSYDPGQHTNPGNKIHEDSVLAPLYPTNVQQPESKYIVEEDEFMRIGRYPAVPCLLQFEDITDCPDRTGNTKYFMRDKMGDLRVLPGVRDPNNREHQCPIFNLEEGPRPLCSEFGASHGTGVASVVAAHALGFVFQGNTAPTYLQGTAYGARILAYARPLHIAGLPANFQEHAAYFQNAPEQADVYNFSHTFGTPVTSVDTSLPDHIHRGFAQIAEAIRNKDIPLIAAAGNASERFPRFPAALPAFFSNLRGMVLAVASTNDEGEITRYSNHCGALPSGWDTTQHGRHYCLAAPGGVSPSHQPFWVAGPDNTQFSTTSGTSFAAPVVAGAFAILKERFRNDNLNDQQIVARLVDTANRSGRYSNVAIYGAGLLDIGAAIMPVGTTGASVMGDVNKGITYDFDTTLLSTSAAFGDALQRAFQTHEIAVFDELDAPFWYPLSSLVTTTSSRETLQERRARLFEYDNAPVKTAAGGKLSLTSSRAGSSGQVDMSLRQPVDTSMAQAELLLTAGDLSTAPFGLHEDKSFAHPYLHFAEEGIGLGGTLQLGTGRLTAMGFTSGSANFSRDIPIDAHGGLLEYALEPLAGVELGVQAGAMVEESRALGLLSEGGFGKMGESSTAFAGVSLDSEFEGNWRFRASMLFGRTNLDEPSIGLLKTSTPLTSSAFRFALEGSDVFMDADRMDVFLAQPLRIENGKADFTVPVGRTPSGLVRREQINGVSLEPGGRELEFGMRYEVQVHEDITATGGLGIVHEGGHSKHTKTELYGLANLRFHF